MNLRYDTGQPVLLGDVLAKAGEGTVYALQGRPDLAAKVFHAGLSDLDTKRAKVAAMAQAQPQGAVQPNGLVVLTWPLHTVGDDAGVAGFVMPRIAAASAVEIHTMSNPSNRRNPGPNSPQWTRNATWQHLVNVAANLCLAVDVVHRVGAVIGDFQERNILVWDTTVVTLVDVDSMQFTDPSGRQFLCAVGRPDFIAPELADADLRTQPRALESDLFALAVHIHQLLMAGNHPFSRGNWVGEGEQPDALTLAKSGEWAGGPQSRLQTHALAPPITFLPIEIQNLFARAFTMGAQDPALRPSAAEWRAELLRIPMRMCERQEHIVPSGALVCPWCAIDDERERRRGSRPPGPPSAPPSRPPGPGVPPPRFGDHWSTGVKVAIATIIALIVVVVIATIIAITSIMSEPHDVRNNRAVVGQGLGTGGGAFMSTGSGSGITDIPPSARSRVLPT